MIEMGSRRVRTNYFTIWTYVRMTAVVLVERFGYETSQTSYANVEFS